MRKRNKRERNLIKRYNKLVKLSSLLYFLAGLGVLAFGIYYREIFEIVFGVFALVFSFANLKNKNYSQASIRRLEQNRLSFIIVFIIIYSLVNPIGNIPLLYDLYKRDLVLNGGFLDE
ncbi:hypothetical protein [Anaerococcus marasmi]|uniref:hypothetical protein n=1 Tax=Anaerococcus marasmi TaxID=2057797 RepID=UPI000CF8D13A|nr:hypothetical protein [Anaerococcus marasmi]